MFVAREKPCEFIRQGHTQGGKQIVKQKNFAKRLKEITLFKA